MNNSDNVIIGEFACIKNSSISFSGKGNVLFLEGSVKLIDSIINFKGSNSLIYLSSNRNEYCIEAVVHNDNTLYLGHDNYFNRRVSFIASEFKNIIVGSECLFSIGIVVRNADAHLIYDLSSNRRVNNSKSIYLGDHVWVGQNTLILKGTVVGSGSILGGGTVISNKIVSSNTIWAGNPARKIKDGVFWSGECVHSWDENVSNRYLERENTFPLIYDENIISISELDRQLLQLTKPHERVEFINDNFKDSSSRMYVK